MLKFAHSDSFSLSEPIMTVSNPRAPLRLNVGFIVHQGIGYSREFDFDVPKLPLPPDQELRDMTGTARFTRTPQGLLAQVKMRATYIPNAPLLSLLSSTTGYRFYRTICLRAQICDGIRFNFTR